MSFGVDRERAKKASLQETILKHTTVIILWLYIYFLLNWFFSCMLISQEEQAANRIAAATFVLCSEGSRIRIMHACFSPPLLFFLLHLITFSDYAALSYIYTYATWTDTTSLCVALHLGHLHAPDQTMSWRERELILTHWRKSSVRHEDAQWDFFPNLRLSKQGSKGATVSPNTGFFSACLCFCGAIFVFVLLMQIVHQNALCH